MANSLSDFAKRMEKRAGKVEVLGNELAKFGSIDALTTLVTITPVDTSEHLSNWQVSLGNPVSSSIPPYVAGSRGSTANVSGQSAINAGWSVIQTKKPAQDLFISNLGPAIGYLDKGSSTQFAGGFVPRAVLVFREAIRAKLPSLLKL